MVLPLLSLISLIVGELTEEEALMKKTDNNNVPSTIKGKITVKVESFESINCDQKKLILKTMITPWSRNFISSRHGSYGVARSSRERSHWIK